MAYQVSVAMKWAPWIASTGWLVKMSDDPEDLAPLSARLSTSAGMAYPLGVAAAMWIPRRGMVTSMEKSMLLASPIHASLRPLRVASMLTWSAWYEPSPVGC